jgi:hypothetical protein
VTTGQPLFCQFCGRTYNVKLCPKHHPNPRTAQVCSQCGSRELTIPAPRIPLWLRPLFFLLTVLPGILLLVVSILFVFAFVRQLITDPNMLFRLMILGLMLGLAWLIYMQLPGFVRKLLHKIIARGGKHDRAKH